MNRAQWRAMLLVIVLLTGPALLVTCGGPSNGVLYVSDVVDKSQDYTGKEITIDGAYVARADQNISVLALGVSTLDSGLDAQPLGEPIWVEGFPEEVMPELHRPGDATYGFVRVTGNFETGGSFGANGEYKHIIRVSEAKAIEQVKRVEHTIQKKSLGEGKVSFFELQENPEAYDRQTITTQGYYFWNKITWVLAEGIATEEDGSSPQALGTPIWMEGFPPDKSSELNVGPNNNYVWGFIEVTGTFQTGGGHGKDGVYQSIINADSVQCLEKKPNN